MVDICIIGGGVIGCAIARELSRLRLSVVLLERAGDVAEGTTKANSAIVHAGYDAEPGSAKARTNLAGNRVFPRWCRELDVPYQNNTSLVVAFSSEQLPSLQKLLARGLENGVPGLRLISREELFAREPNISPTAAGALLAETGGICCPYELTIALAAHAVLNGLDLRLNCEVQSVENRSGAFRVHTNRGIVESRLLVNAAGVYADIINNQLSQDHFRITPRRGEYWMVDKSFAGSFKATIFQLPTAMGKGVLVTPTVEGTLILGPTAEDIDDREDTRTTAARLDEILRVASASWAGIPGKSFITAFSGLRAHSDRGDFILGESPDVPGLINAAGIESPGLTAAPAIGSEIAALAAGLLGARRKEEFMMPWPGAQRFRFLSDDEKRAVIARDPAYGRVVCRCEQITEAEIRAAIRRPVGASTVDGVKRRTRAGMGRCQGGFCTPRVLDILSDELGVPPQDLTKFGGASFILSKKRAGRGENLDASSEPASPEAQNGGGVHA